MYVPRAPCCYGIGMCGSFAGTSTDSNLPFKVESNFFISVVWHGTGVGGIRWYGNFPCHTKATSEDVSTSSKPGSFHRGFAKMEVEAWPFLEP